MIKDKDWVEFKKIEEAMNFCNNLEIASHGKYIYRPLMDNFQCIRLVTVNKNTKIMQTMTSVEYCRFHWAYEV